MSKLGFNINILDELSQRNYFQTLLISMKTQLYGEKTWSKRS